MKDFLRYKNEMLVKPYTQIVYVSPNLADNAASFTHEQSFIHSMRSLAEPVPIDFLGELPKIETIMSYIKDENSKVLLMIDDFQYDLFQSEAVASVYTRLSSHFGVDILATTHTGFATGSKYYGNIKKNTNLIIMFPCLIDKTTAVHLQKTIFLYQPGFLVQCQERVYDLFGKYAFLAISVDIHKDLPRRFPVSARIFPFKNKNGETVIQPLWFRYKPPIKK